MKDFHCNHCENPVVFENFRCVSCQHLLAFLPDLGIVGSLDRGEDDLWQSPLARAKGNTYRFCQNYTAYNVCNWAIASEDNNSYCLSCRLTSIIPNLSNPEHKEAWFKLEAAKRRLIYSLLSLKLPVESKKEQPETGLAFELLADPATSGSPKVLTGHDNGVITVNISEADDAERERIRHQMHEGYRTLFGHFRHEVGHYYWDRLIRDSPYIDRFRELFGDDRDNYDAAVKRHYQDGTPPDWQDHFISAYASTHPWEDWAETWAHSLHMVDTVETALDCGLTLKPKWATGRVLKPDSLISAGNSSVFDTMIDSWYALTYALNNLNRGMGLPDAYPFVLSAPVIEKLRFVNEIVVGKVA